MIKKTLQSVLLLLLILVGTNCSAESWRGITPLKSTRADVERQLGKPTLTRVGVFADYVFEEEDVTVLYSSKELCDRPEMCECGVPDDTVLDISVRPRRQIKFSDLRIDASRFSRVHGVEDAIRKVYLDSVSGLAYSVSKRDDLLLSTKYGSSEKDCQEVLDRLKKSSPVSCAP